ncbi:MAG TPA: FKBP-type peptidyl-prolyl cis-trans isomerase [Acidisarcina sp.]|nr:FKBP-type peptidyl-prolyl cis-trans isomerase [Acidisarcina sp.]
MILPRPVLPRPVLSRLVLLGLISLFALPAQTPAQTTAPAPHRSTTHRATAQRRSASAAAKSTQSTADEIKLPASIPAAQGTLHTEYALRYIDVVAGTGAAAEPGMIYFVHYTGWLYDGTKFDSSVDRGAPIQFQQGQHRVISGWDTGFEGMKVGGKRRLFIPYQLAYGDRANGPIPAKSNLIFDVELVDVKDPNAAPAENAPAK